MTLADTPEMTESRENVTARQLERDDDLIWCPSQCHANVIAPNGTKAVLYLRWRHADPWQASIVVGFHEGDGVSTSNPHVRGFQRWSVEGDWNDVSIGEWSQHDDLAEIKSALVAKWDEVKDDLSFFTSGREK